eukprot:6428824-Heterocapsa_arctica.AAC.1
MLWFTSAPKVLQHYVVGQLLYQCCATVGPLWDHFGTTVGPLLDHCWTTAGSLLEHFCTTSEAELLAMSERRERERERGIF